MPLLLQTFSKKIHVDQTIGTFCSSSNEEGQCFLPRDNWAEFVFESPIGHPKPFCKSISLVDIDPYVRILFWEKIAPIFLGAEEDTRKAAFKNYVTDIVTRLEKYSNILTEKLITYELIINPPGLTSTAYNHMKNFEVGLHIDTHNTPDIDNRNAGFHLLAINLGTQYRYFHFALESVKDMLKALNKQSTDYSYVRNLKDDFLNAFPRNPIFRLKIEPDQAYIAVSQNIIHDGATNKNGAPDVVLLLAGYFSLKS